MVDPSPADTNGDKMNWVTIKKFSDLCGYSQDAVRAKIKKSQWVIDQQFKRAPDGRILIGIKEVEKWIAS